MKKILVVVCLVLLMATFVSVEHTTAATRFVKNNDGTVTDTETGLMWADRDNGSDINWPNAKIYCEGYVGGGKSGWRMPTIAELKNLHGSGAYGSVIAKTDWFVWSSETSDSDAAGFYFYSGFRGWFSQSLDFGYRALPVRSGK